MQALEALVVGGGRDRVVFAGQVIGGKAPGQRLLVVGVRLGQGMWLLRPCLALGAEHMLHPGVFEQIADLGGVDEQLRAHRVRAPALQVQQVGGAQAVAVAVHGEHAVAPQHRHLPTGRPRCQHLVDHPGGDPGLVTQRADVALARVEQNPAPRRRRQRQMAPVVGANGPAELGVALRGDHAFDPRVLVGRHALRGELAAQPVELLDQDHALAKPRGGQRGRHAAEAAADDQHAGGLFVAARRGGQRGGGHGAPCLNRPSAPGGGSRRRSAGHRRRAAARSRPRCRRPAPRPGWPGAPSRRGGRARR